MALRAGALILLLLPLFLLSSSVSQDCDPKCITNNCDSDRFCICDLPSNLTMLSGDRLFYGGEFCDIPQTMCDGTNSFWCQNGTCNEIIQGENYTCICQDGYAGEHCELKGIPCGDIYCYQNGECLQADLSCDCPTDWMGSDDCSKPTVKSIANDSPPATPAISDQDKNKKAAWYLPVIVAAAIVVLVIVLFIGLRSMRRRASATNDFRKLQLAQMQEFADEEDEESFAHAPLSKAQLA